MVFPTYWFGSVRFEPKLTKPDKIDLTESTETDPSSFWFGLVLGFGGISVFRFVRLGRVGFGPMLTPIEIDIHFVRDMVTVRNYPYQLNC